MKRTRLGGWVLLVVAGSIGTNGSQAWANEPQVVVETAELAALARELVGEAIRVELLPGAGGGATDEAARHRLRKAAAVLYRPGQAEEPMWRERLGQQGVPVIGLTVRSGTGPERERYELLHGLHAALSRLAPQQRGLLDEQLRRAVQRLVRREPIPAVASGQRGAP